MASYQKLSNGQKKSKSNGFVNKLVKSCLPSDSNKYDRWASSSDDDEEHLIFKTEVTTAAKSDTALKEQTNNKK